MRPDNIEAKWLRPGESTFLVAVDTDEGGDGSGFANVVGERRPCDASPATSASESFMLAGAEPCSAGRPVTSSVKVPSTHGVHVVVLSTEAM
jgi:hypothetical protein